MASSIVKGFPVVQVPSPTHHQERQFKETTLWAGDRSCCHIRYHNVCITKLWNLSLAFPSFVTYMYHLDVNGSFLPCCFLTASVFNSFMEILFLIFPHKWKFVYYFPFLIKSVWLFLWQYPKIVLNVTLLGIGPSGSHWIKVHKEQIYLISNLEWIECILHENNEAQFLSSPLIKRFRHQLLHICSKV